MSDLFWLTDKEMRRIETYFPHSNGIPRVDDKRALSGTIFVIRNGLRWHDATSDYGPYKTIYNGFDRWSRLGVFNRIFAELSAKSPRPERLMFDATHLKAHRTAASLQKGAVPRCIGRTKGGLNPEHHAVCDDKGRPLIMLLSEGQMSDYKGAALMIDALSGAKAMLGDRGYEADWFRTALIQRGITPCIRRRRAARSGSTTTGPSTASATGSRICSAGSRTGRASSHATTAAPTPS